MIGLPYVISVSTARLRCGRIGTQLQLHEQRVQRVRHDQHVDPGAQQAFVLTRALRDHDVYVTNSRAPSVVENCLMEAEATVADAVDAGSDVLVVPDALNTLLV